MAAAARSSLEDKQLNLFMGALEEDMKSLRARLDRLERRLAQRGERNYQHELELFGRSTGGDEKAFEAWTAIVIADQSDEPPAPLFRALQLGVAVNFAYRENDKRN